MKKIPEKFLPLGTVVMLQGGTKRLMITGFCVIDIENKTEAGKKVWDYCGCLYPEGFLSYDQMCLFKHNQIKEIYHLGLNEDEDNEEKEFKKNLKKYIQENSEIFAEDVNQDTEKNNNDDSETDSNDNEE